MQCILKVCLLVCICLKSVLRYTFLILCTCHPNSVYLHEQGCEDPWLFFEAKRVPRAKMFGKRWAWGLRKKNNNAPPPPPKKKIRKGDSGLDWGRAYRRWRCGVHGRGKLSWGHCSTSPTDGSMLSLCRTIFVNAFSVLCRQKYVRVKHVGCIHRSIAQGFDWNPSEVYRSGRKVALSDAR